MRNGFLAISSVLIISVVVLAIVISVSYLAIAEGQSALALSKGEDTLDFVEGCMEDALMKIQANASYAGGSITRPEGTCSISVSQAGNTYTVTATTNDTKYVRTVRAGITRGAIITITSWQEI